LATSPAVAVFTVGLMFFAGMLILHSIIAVYAYFAMEPLYADLKDGNIT
jgi:hypothetical protein